MFLRDFSGNGVGASTEHCPSGDDLITEMLDKARKILAKGISRFFVKEIILCNGIGADGAAGAFLAKITEVKLIDPLHHGAEMSGIVGEKSRFKVAFVGGFCPESCACQIGGADEGMGAIDDDGFGVNARAENTLKMMAVNQMRVAIKVGPKTRTGFLGVHQPNVDTLFDQVRKNF
jgi:hypothetical protein